MSTFCRTLLLPALVLLLAIPATAAEDPEQAFKDLAELETYIKKKKKTSPDDFGPYLDAVRKAYKNFAMPEKPADDAGEDVKKKFASDLKKAQRAQADFDKRAEKALFKAVKVARIDRSGTTNELDEVNVHAAKLLGELAGIVDDDKKAAISKKLMKEIDALEKAKYQVRSDHLEAMFASLAKHNRLNALTWMTENFIHSKSRDEDIVRLIAAHKAMILFKNVPGKQRYAVCKEMIKTYSGVESQAEQSSSDPAVQAKKAFWDRVRVEAIKVVQYYGGEPLDEDKQLINTMGGFQKWWRSVKSPKAAVWKDEKLKKE